MVTRLTISSVSLFLSDLIGVFYGFGHKIKFSCLDDVIIKWFQKRNERGKRLHILISMPASNPLTVFWLIAFFKKLAIMLIIEDRALASS